MPNEIDWSEYFKAYVPTVIILISLFSLLALPNYTLPVAILQTIVITLLSYGGHIFAHAISNDGPLSYLNPHIFLHHKKLLDIPRWLELVIEAIFNFLAFYIIIIIQKLSGFHIFSTSLVIGAALLYVIIHIFDYSIHGNEKHGLHHKNTFCNYDPEFLDTLFGTRCDPEKPYTDMYEEIPHIIVAFCLTGILKLCMGLD